MAKEAVGQGLKSSAHATIGGSWRTPACFVRFRNNFSDVFVCPSRVVWLQVIKAHLPSLAGHPLMLQGFELRVTDESSLLRRAACGGVGDEAGRFTV